MESLTFLNACLKLQKRHLLEWNKLAVNQQMVLELIKEKYTSEVYLPPNDRMALANVSTQRAIQLIRVMEGQREERRQMRTRQKQEEILLKEVSVYPIKA